MVSNKLSQRRAILKRPIVCRKPPPEPEPPAPPPPPPDWPPNTFTLNFLYRYPVGPFEQTTEWSTLFTFVDPPGDRWIGDETGTDAIQLIFSINETNQTGRLLINGYNWEVDYYIAEAENIPLDWGNTATYVIESWTDLTDWITFAHADFNF